MSIYLQRILSDIQDPREASYFTRHSDNEEIFYDPNKKKFEFVSNQPFYSSWIQRITFQRSELIAERQKTTWEYLMTRTNTLIGEQFAKTAFTQIGLFKLIKHHQLPTLASYNMLKEKVILIEQWEFSAYEVWKAGRFYDLFRTTKKSVIFEPDYDYNTPFTINTGRRSLWKYEDFTTEKIAEFILKIFWQLKFDCLDEENINKIAISIHQDVILKHDKDIKIDEFITLINNYIKAKRFKINKPEYFESLKTLIRQNFLSLELKQIKLLAKMARPHFARKEKENKYNQDEDIRVKSARQTTCKVIIKMNGKTTKTAIIPTKHLEDLEYFLKQHES